jgi:hypothetical protein
MNIHTLYNTVVVTTRLRNETLEAQAGENSTKCNDNIQSIITAVKRQAISQIFAADDAASDNSEIGSDNRTIS